MKKVFLLFLFCISLYAKETPSAKATLVASEIINLNDSQKEILCEFAVLQKNNANENDFWLKNKNRFPAFNDSIRNQLADEIFNNSHLVYTPVKNSSIQMWMQVQSLTNWMLYLAAFIAICAVIGLLRNYWNRLIDILIRQFAPLFRLLFSAIILTYELLLIGVFCIVGGCLVEDFFLRTVIIHTGLFLLWSQTTAIFTRKYLVQKYIFEVKDNFWRNDKWEVVKTISLPAMIVTISLLYVLYKLPEDVFYNYEIALSGLALIYSLPFWRFLERYIYPVLVPFKDDKLERVFHPLATCTVIALVVDIIFMWQQNPVFPYLTEALTSLLVISFIILSLKENYRSNYKNYYYMQLVIIAFFSFVLWYGFNVQSGKLIWILLIGSSVFLLIKYWEILTFFVGWKTKKLWKWGFLGMAVLLWLLAKGILYVSKILYVI